MRVGESAAAVEPIAGILGERHRERGVQSRDIKAQVPSAIDTRWPRERTGPAGRPPRAVRVPDGVSPGPCGRYPRLDFFASPNCRVAPRLRDVRRRRSRRGDYCPNEANAFEHFRSPFERLAGARGACTRYSAVTADEQLLLPGEQLQTPGLSRSTQRYARLFLGTTDGP
jgi:hypothetical protein